MSQDIVHATKRQKLLEVPLKPVCSLTGTAMHATMMRADVGFLRDDEAYMKEGSWSAARDSNPGPHGPDAAASMGIAVANLASCG